MILIEHKYQTKTRNDEKADLQRSVRQNASHAKAKGPSSVDANTRAIANMDRRQKKFFTFLAPVQQKLATIFHRKEKNPYAAVTVSEPRRSQLIEVIDYTMTHPIEYDSKTRDAFTLSNAARAVWNLRHKAWKSAKGGGY